jgi:hypothetical protein
VGNYTPFYQGSEIVHIIRGHDCGGRGQESPGDAREGELELSW